MTTHFVPFDIGSSGKRATSSDTSTNERKDAPEVSEQSALSRRLTDFSQPHKKSVDSPVVEETAPEIEPEAAAPPHITLLQSEIDELCRTAFETGRDEGCRTTQQTMENKFSTQLADIKEAFDTETTRRVEAARKTGKVYIQTVLDLLVALTRLPGETLRGLKRDLVQDAADLVTLCEEEIVIRCNEKDKERLKTLIGSNSKTRFEPCAEAVASTIRIESETRTILVDPEKWRQSVIDRILASVSASIDQKTTVPETTDRQ
ncbi:hypothetical protein [Asaia prunellae]|uniref:hypothetical protein n=1 Tax=Asaia prunellae TaxID=610245 RepID=UPI00046FC2BC|nr:hypothetical protein [Asaia prunellae]